MTEKLIVHGVSVLQEMRSFAQWMKARNEAGNPPQVCWLAVMMTLMLACKLEHMDADALLTNARKAFERLNIMSEHAGEKIH